MNIINKTLVPIEVIGEGVIPPGDSMGIPDFPSVFLKSKHSKDMAEIQCFNGNRKIIFNNSGLVFSVMQDNVIIQNA